MTKIIVVYESKYGNTKIVAEKIAEGLGTGKEMKIDVRNLKDLDLDRIPECDVILIGSPNHMGRHTRGIKKFIDKLGKLNLKNKFAAVFDTCVSKDFEKAVKKMENHLAKVTPGLRLVSLGLSIRVEGMKGPIAEEDLPKCEEFGKRIAAQIR
nr:flavodoxin family protein [Candidatus Njordarchaeota archaeon]